MMLPFAHYAYLVQRHKMNHPQSLSCIYSISSRTQAFNRLRETKTMLSDSKHLSRYICQKKKINV